MDRINYEIKFNYYKKSELVNKNYKMKKYLYKLNGGAGSYNFDIDIDTLPDLGSGFFGIVKQDKDFTINHFGIVKEYEDFAIKYIDFKKFYDDEKELFIKKISIPCGKINIETNQYNSPDNTINYDLTDDNFIKISDEIYIMNNILEYIKSIGPIEIQQLSNIIININSISIDNELNIYGILDKIFIIGTFVNNQDNTYSIYIDTFKNMRLLYFNDEKQLLFYKNLGLNLNITMQQFKISFIHRVLLCIDLIRQVKDLLDVGIYHSDIKNDNIVIKQSKDHSTFYLTIIDFGISTTLRDIRYHYDLGSNALKYSTSIRQFNPENIIIFKLITDGFIKDGNKYPFDKLKDLFDKSIYWILGGICINILEWSNIQDVLYRKYLYNSTYNNETFYLYVEELRIHIPISSDDGLIYPIYDDLKQIINNLLEIHAEKNSLSDYFTLLNKEPYQSYLIGRKESQIDY